MTVAVHQRRRTVRERPATTVRLRPVAARLPTAVETTLAALGEPLAPDVRGEMEQRLGHDFANVRIHADARAAAAARALDSVAFTSGAHIVFAEGRYQPHTVEGGRLLAHELVHTLQQGGRTVQTVSLQVSSALVATADPLEVEAAALADLVVAGLSVPAGAVSVGDPAVRGRIARQARGAIARAPREDSLGDIQALADDVARLLLFDPEDTFGRARHRLARLASATREAVAAAVRGRVTGPAAARLDAILVELRPPGAGPPPESTDRVEIERPSFIEALVSAWRGVVDRLRPRPEPSTAEVPREPAREREPIVVPTDLQPTLADADPPPEQIAAAAVTGLAAPETADAPPEPEQTTAPTDSAPARDASPLPRPSWTEETSETGEDADPRIAEVNAIGPEDAGDEAAAGEAAEPVAAPTALAADVHPTAGAAPPGAPSAGASGAAAALSPDMAPAAADLAEGAPPLGATLAGGAPGPDMGPADADPAAGAPPPDEAREVAAEATSDAMDEADERVGGPGEPQAAPPEPGPVEAGASGELEEAEQPAAEPAAEPTIGTVELGSLAEVEPDEDDVAAGDGGVEAGAPIEASPTPETPALGGGEPEAGIAAVASLPPTVAAVALGDVRAAAASTVAAKRAELVAVPPQLERPTGAPTRAEAAAEASAPGPQRAPAKIMRAPAGASFSTPVPAPLPAAPAPPIAAVPGLQIGGPTAQMTEADVAAIRDSVKALPTTDPALNVTAGAPPPLLLQGDADPARADEQRAEVDKATVATRKEGAADAAAPMGEAAVLPAAAPETLRAAIVDARPSAGVPAPPRAITGADPAVDAVIAERRPGDMQSAAATAQTNMATERQQQTQATQAAGVESRANIEKEVAENAAKQRSQRDDLRRDVREQRVQWTAAQTDLVDRSQADADKATAKLATDVATEREKGTIAADKHIAEGDAKVATARTAAEHQAQEARRKGEEEPSGFLDWVASKATAFFESIKTAIKSAFEAARKAVKDAIETAQKLAAEAIDAARNAVVKAIKLVGDALIEIGDRVLTGFPGLRTKFRGAIRTAVSAAERAVNVLADGLKVAVQAYLNLYAKALDGILGLLETGLLAVVDVYAAAIDGAIKAAQFVLNGLGDLLQVAKDIASGPRAWLRNLGAAIVDGIRNHLWATLKVAISEWFDAKVDAILGLGKIVWNVLAKGGITLAAVAKFAFAALKKVIPIALIKLLITKLIGMLVPAAAAVMAIIEGLQAAWGAAGSIIGAISKFIVFLKAVKGGNAGLQFAEAVAAAAVAVIEFVSFWLLRRLLKPAAKVGKAIKGVAAKIAAMLRRLVQALKRGIKKFTRRVKTWLRKAGRRFKKLKQRFLGKGKKKNKRERQEERLGRAAAAIKPPLEAMLRKGTSNLVLWGRLRWWQVRWWLSSLTAASSGEITARINPARLLARSERIKVGKDLEKILIAAETRYLDKYRAELAQDPVLSKPLNDARQALATGRRDLPELSRKDQILLLRDIQAGVVAAPGLPVRGQGLGHLRFGPENLTVRNVHSTAEMVVQIGGGGNYPDLVRTIEREGRLLGLSQAQMAGLIRARTPEEFSTLSQAAVAGMNAQRAALFRTKVSQRLRNVGFLTQALEPARGPGLMAATSLAGEVSTSPRQLMGWHGQFAPISQVGAAGTLAAERAAAAGMPRPMAPGKAREQQQLRAARHSRIAQIFLHLRHLARTGELQGLAGAHAGILRDVAEKFDTWTKARFEVLRPDALEKAADELTAALIAWLKRFYG